MHQTLGCCPSHVFTFFTNAFLSLTKLYFFFQGQSRSRSQDGQMWPLQVQPKPYPGHCKCSSGSENISFAWYSSGVQTLHPQYQTYLVRISILMCLFPCAPCTHQPGQHHSSDHHRVNEEEDDRTSM